MVIRIQLQSETEGGGSYVLKLGNNLKSRKTKGG